MAIPELNDDGFLPEGVHECYLDELQQRFGETDRRKGILKVLP